MSTTAEQPAPPPANAATDVDATVEQLLRDANAGGAPPPAPAPAPVPAARPAPVAHRAPSTDELPQELVGPGGVVIARREPESRAPEPASNGSHASAAPKPVAPRPDELLNTMQADLAPAPAPAPAAPPVAPTPATIEDLDAALAKKASVQLADNASDASPLARAVAANPVSAPTPPAGTPATATTPPPPAPMPILRPDAPQAAARSGAPPIAAATPAAVAQTPAPAPVVTEPKRSLVQSVLGPIAMKAERLSPAARQTMLWAAFVTMISAAAMWTIVLIRDPNAVPTEAPVAKAAHGEASHAEPAAKHEEAKPKPKPAAAKSGGHH